MLAKLGQCFRPWSTADETAPISDARQQRLDVHQNVVLTGEVRAVTGLETRLHEAAQLGFTQAVVPKSNLVDAPRLPLETRGVATVHDALDVLLS